MSIAVEESLKMSTCEGGGERAETSVQASKMAESSEVRLVCVAAPINSGMLESRITGPQKTLP